MNLYCGKFYIGAGLNFICKKMGCQEEKKVD